MSAPRSYSAASALRRELEQMFAGERFSADEWWDEYEAAIEAMHAEARESVSGKTLAVALRSG